ncbi:MAG: ketoacyl-ACP synthase III [Firmicutes bacterium]|nr:ketoacyl-ACP synthase III [Bacillota bacterium]
MSNYPNIKVISTGHYVPEKILSNHDLEQIVSTTNEWIVSRTGIKNRRIAEGENTSDLAVKAAKDAILSSNYDTSKIDLIIVATFTPDYKSPSVASLVQAKLGLNNQEITAFDLNAACTGFIYALNVASRMLESKAFKSALVIGAEVISKVTDYTDRNTCVLFGDGAGAVLLELTNEYKPAMFYTASKGDLDKILYVDEFVHMDGQKVYQFASKAIEKSILKLLEFDKSSFDKIDTIIPHQANLRIIQSASKSLKIPMENFFLNIELYGNTSAASCAIALDEYVKSSVDTENQAVLLVAFGAGLTWGGARLTL